MYCQMFSTGFSSGHLGGSGKIVMFGGTTSRFDMCAIPLDRRGAPHARPARLLHHTSEAALLAFKLHNLVDFMPVRAPFQQCSAVSRCRGLWPAGPLCISPIC